MLIANSKARFLRLDMMAQFMYSVALNWNDTEV